MTENIRPESEENKDSIEVSDNIEKVKQGLKEIYREHIQREIGMDLSDSDLSAIDEYIGEKATESPETLLVLAEKIALFKELPEQIKKLEKQLYDLGARGELSKGLTEKMQLTEKLKEYDEYRGFKGKMSLMLMKREERAVIQDAIDTVERIYGNLDQTQVAKILQEVETEIEKTTQALSSIENTERLRRIAEEMFGKVRNELLGQVSGIGELSAAVRSKALTQLREMIDKGTAGTLLEAQRRFKQLTKHKQTAGVDINLLSDEDKIDLQQRIDTALEGIISEEIRQAVITAEMDRNGVTRLEGTLRLFFKRDGLGSKQARETREFVVETLRKIEGELDETIPNRVKKMIIARIIMEMTEN